MIGGLTWLITGGTGFFGQHFTRYLLDQCHPQSVRIFSRSESKQAAMVERLSDSRLRWLIGDVRDGDRLSMACRGVDVVVHAAALKRVDTCEAQPWEALATNVMGTREVMQACLDQQVQRAVLLSTDKAPGPETFYGITKLCAERLWVQGNVYAAGRPTRFAVTRYGNVLGSTGSVVELWRSQAAAGGPVTVTDPEATRFWMTATEGCALVARALERMQGGETYVPMIRAASLGQLMAACVPPDMPMTVTGLRRSEKRHEVLLTEEERRRAWVSGGDLIVIEPVERSWSDRAVLRSGELLRVIWASDTVARYSVDELRAMVMACV